VNKYYNKIIIVVCVALYGALANAADGYMGLDIGQMSMSFTTEDDDFADTRTRTLHTAKVSPIVMKARIGVILLPDSSTHLSIESHIGFGVNKTSANINGSDINMRLESLLALYLKADLLTVGPVSVFGLVGYGTAQSNRRGVISGYERDENGVVKTDPNDTTVRFPVTKPYPETESGASYGLGFNYFINKDWSAQVEYLDVVERDSDLGFDISGVSIGVNMALE
jgi:opacity protein-like surface antigen